MITLVLKYFEIMIQAAANIASERTLDMLLTYYITLNLDFSLFYVFSVLVCE